VIFNGIDVTPLIPTCAAERQRLYEGNEVVSNRERGSANIRGSSSKSTKKTSFKSSAPFACSLTAFGAQINSLILPHSNYEEACA
jgi:hypothetical protein